MFITFWRWDFNLKGYIERVGNGSLLNCGVGVTIKVVGIVETLCDADGSRCRPVDLKWSSFRAFSYESLVGPALQQWTAQSHKPSWSNICALVWNT